jgi:hypothetical protein
MSQPATGLTSGLRQGAAPMNNICPSCGHIDGFEYPNIKELIKRNRLKRLKGPKTLKKTEPWSLNDQPVLTCPQCDRPIILLDIATAAAIVQKSRKTICNWVKQVRIKFLLLPDGRVLIFYNSLFLPPSTNGHPESE